MIVFVLGIEVLMTPLMLPFELTVLAAMRASGVRVPMEFLVLGVQISMALLVFFGQLVMDAPMRSPLVMCKGQGRVKQ